MYAKLISILLPTPHLFITVDITVDMCKNLKFRRIYMEKKTHMGKYVTPIFKGYTY